MDNQSFYSNLPVLNNFIEITEYRNFHSVPDEWYVIITDIVSSTKAIEAGRYKDVNLLGACCIAAVLNVTTEVEIPFVFGGDGAAILIPPSLYSEAMQALLATRQIAQAQFGLDLRVGAVPVLDIIKGNYDVKVVKVKVSENYYQAAFTGNGLNYATELIKNPATADLYNYKKTDSNAEANFSGLECRWQDIPSKYGEMVSLIVKANSDKSEINLRIYQEVIEHIQAIYGSEERLKPIAPENLNPSFNYNELKSEINLVARSSNFWNRLIYLSRILLENLWRWFLTTFKIKLSGIDWGFFKPTIVAATDYEKFDDMLRIVMAGDRIQRKQLTSYLEKSYKEGKLAYGLHVSDRALMTCLVFEPHGKQVHFVDGADGGYTAAAKAMKQRINGVLYPSTSST